MLLVKMPIPLLSLVFVVPAIVGFVAVPQQTPLAVTSAPPSEVMFPPEVAAVVVIPLIAVVVSVGISGSFLHP